MRLLWMIWIRSVDAGPLRTVLIQLEADDVDTVISIVPPHSRVCADLTIHAMVSHAPGVTRQLSGHLMPW